VRTSFSAPTPSTLGYVGDAVAPVGPEQLHHGQEGQSACPYLLDRYHIEMAAQVSKQVVTAVWHHASPWAGPQLLIMVRASGESSSGECGLSATYGSTFSPMS
jgi:hypothetical protein